MKKAKKNILIVFGTRPEAIKMAPLIHEFRKRDKCFDMKVCVTGQHRKMLDQVLDFFEIKPDFDLNIMKPNQDLFDVTINVLEGMKNLFKSYKPDLVLVHGDTTSASSVSLAAFYNHIKVGHVEAGLRTYDLSKPWPEEANRQLISVISDYNFAPTSVSKKNLESDGKKNIWVTGNTVVDALIFAKEKINNNADLQESIVANINTSYNLNPSRKIILITAHRRENFGEGFINICKAIEELANKNPNLDFIYPVHLNPNVSDPVNEMLGNIKNVYLIAPASYEVFIFLMQNSYFIITDSGGIQEEAPSLGKPVLVLRQSTERPEGIEAGTAVLVGSDTNSIVTMSQSYIDDKDLYIKTSLLHNPYGDGAASQNIIDVIEKEL
jgi:UDP-N-acetylglucosamine 2-epimerase (non-hydrolysing)